MWIVKSLNRDSTMGRRATLLRAAYFRLCPWQYEMLCYCDCWMLLDTILGGRIFDCAQKGTTTTLIDPPVMLELLLTADAAWWIVNLERSINNIARAIWTLSAREGKSEEREDVERKRVTATSTITIIYH